MLIKCLSLTVLQRFTILRVSGALVTFPRKMFISCNLICPNNTHDPIPLPDGIPVVLGRSKDTRIIDLSCSRNQLEITANWKNEEVNVKQLGTNSSAIDGVELEKGRVVKIQTTSTLYLLTGLYPHKIDAVKESPKKQLNKGDIKSVKNEKKRPIDENNCDKDSSRVSPPTKRQKKNNDTESCDRNNSSKKYKSSSERSSVPSAERSSGKGVTKSHNNDSDDDDHMNSVEEKLKLMKKKKKENEQNHRTESPDKKSISPKRDAPEFKFSDKKEGVPATEDKWDQYDKLVIFTKKGVLSRSKIAGFDIDGTIIVTQSGNVFPKHPGDWRIHYPEIPAKLKKLHAEGYKIVFFTNQLGVARGKTKLEDLKTKFTSLVTKLGVPIQILISTGEGMYRKPAQGMFYYLQEKGNDKIMVDKDSSFYVGDGAGRPEKWKPKRKKDFSCGDRLFALNIGMKFYTPEEYFLGEKEAPYKLPDFDPRKLKSTDSLSDPPDAKIVSDKTEVVLFVGYPASGKSFFGKTYLEPAGYVHINRDTLGTWQKCVSMATKSIKEGKSVMIDNTNPDAESRARYIEVAKKAGVPCRCFLFTATYEQVLHNERFREMTDKNHKPINVMIMNGFRSKLKNPEMKEGFLEIVKINFVPKFENKKQELLYKQFLVEK